MTTESTPLPSPNEALNVYEKIKDKVFIDLEIKCRADLRKSIKRYTRQMRDKVSEILFEYAAEEESKVDGKIKSRAYHGYEEFKHTLDGMIEQVIDTAIDGYLKRTISSIVQSYGTHPTKFNLERFMHHKQPAYDQLGRRVDFVRKDKIGITYIEHHSKRQLSVNLEEAMHLWVMRNVDEESIEA